MRRNIPTTYRLWIAHTPPYTGRHLDALLKEAGRHAFAKITTIGRSIENRPLRQLTITDPAVPEASKKVLWFFFRQHAWETGSSWAGDGAVRFLLSDAPAARSIRKGAVVHIFPECDPDGMARGGVRFNRKGYDLNRNWDTDNPAAMPEITSQRKAVLAWVDAGKRIDFLLSLHNTETSEYLEGPPGDVASHAALGERLFAALKEGSAFAPTRAFFRAESTTTAGKPGRMTVTQGLYHHRKLPAFLIEQMIARNPRLGRFPAIADRVRFGADLVQAAWLAVRSGAD